VMAGCKPEYFPVLLAATEAMLDPAFNLIGPSSSQGSAAVLTIVNGPIARELQINCRNNLFGPGHRANATIGRAIRLILMNACASIPGLFDRSIIGESAKYSYCIAENETETHWLPLHVERGFDREQSTVTVFACWSPRQLRCDADPRATLDCAADVASFHAAPRLHDLTNKRLGLIDDCKENAQELLEELTAVLRQRFGIANVVYHRKPSASKPAAPEVIQELAQTCDYVIVAIGS
jgi:hypothetical protein